MKTYDITKRMSAQARAQLERILSTHARFKNVHFFTPDSPASCRRKAEEKFSRNNPPVAFRRGSELIEVRAFYEQTCNHVYYSLKISVTADGETSAKNIGFLKALVNGKS